MALEENDDKNAINLLGKLLRSCSSSACPFFPSAPDLNYSAHSVMNQTAATYFHRQYANLFLPEGSVSKPATTAMKTLPLYDSKEVNRALKKLGNSVSSLTSNQHFRYLQLKDKLTQAQTLGFPSLLALTAEEQKELETLQTDVSAEQNEYILLQKSASLSKKDKYLHVPTHIEHALLSSFQHQIKEIKASCPRYFAPCAEIDLRVISPCTALPKHLASVFAASVECDVINIPDKVLDLKSLKFRGNPSSLLISNDRIIEDIMKKKKIDFVLTSSTLITLLDNHGPDFEHEWKIFANVSDSGSSKQIFINKPILRKEYSGREKFSKYINKKLRNSFFESTKNTDEDTSTCLPDANFTYHTWDINGFTVLIRCKLHGRVTCKDSFEFASVHAKMEYLSQGCEQITQSEKCRFWAHSWLRGNNNIVIGRVTHKEKLIKKETYTLGSILSCGNQTIDVLSKFSLLFETLSSLHELPRGEYLVSHTSGSSKVTILSKATTPTSDPTNTTLDLHSIVEESGKTSTEKMDYVVHQWKHDPKVQQIPYTFPLQNYCITFYRTGSCSRLSKRKECSLIHLRPNIKDDTKFELFKRNGDSSFTLSQRCIVSSDLKYCYQFSITGGCISGKNCTFNHIPLDVVLRTLAEREYSRKHNKASKYPRGKRQKIN